MREIKFRAWDGRYKEFKHCELTYDKNHYGSSITGTTATGGAEPWQQYTGLKDKNGVEIYEGDIVRNIYSKDNGFTDKHFDDAEVVKWNGEYYRYDVGEFMDLGEAANDPYTTLEVIGNVWQNPELLEKS